MADKTKAELTNEIVELRAQVMARESCETTALADLAEAQEQVHELEACDIKNRVLWESQSKTVANLQAVATQRGGALRGARAILHAYNESSIYSNVFGKGWGKSIVNQINAALGA